MAKIGRNDPCHCGKGLKYKVCCGRDQRDDKARRYEELRRAESGLIRRLFGLADSLLGETTKDAMYEWFLSTTTALPYEEEMMIYGPWYLYCWQPDDLKERGPTIAAACLQLMGPRLSSDEKMIIQSLNLQPFSFWDVIDVRPGQGFRVRDIFRGIELDIEERKASTDIQVNDIVFGIFVQLDGIGFAMGMAPFSIPPIEKGAVIKLRYELREKHGNSISSDVLLEEQRTLRKLFFTIREHLFNPPMPQLCNTDGDPFVPHKRRSLGLDAKDISST